MNRHSKTTRSSLYNDIAATHPPTSTEHQKNQAGQPNQRDLTDLDRAMLARGVPLALVLRFKRNEPDDLNDLGDPDDPDDLGAI